MPPALFLVGTEEPLLDDTLFMAARWQAAGNDTQLAVYPGAPHGFNGMNTAMGRHGNNVIHEFLRTGAGPDTPGVGQRSEIN